VSRKRRRQSAELFNYLARFIILLGLLTYVPVATWWKNIPPSGRSFMIAMATIAVVAGSGAVVMYKIYQKRERANAWRRAMTGWQNSEQINAIVKRQSAIYMSDVELERFAAQVYKKMGYKVQHVGAIGDHGVDVLMINPNNQREIVQCKQWNKPVGEPAIRDLYGAMMHEKAIRGWLWAPRGFSESARVWAKEKPIELVDDKKINYLIEFSFRKK